jgi:hypothetical protein
MPWPYTCFFKIRPLTDMQVDVSGLANASHTPQIRDSYSYAYVSQRHICRRACDFKILIREAQTLRFPYPALKKMGSWMESDLMTWIVFRDCKLHVSLGPIYTVHVQKEIGSCGWMWPFGLDFLQGGLQCMSSGNTDDDNSISPFITERCSVFEYLHYINFTD